VNAIRTASFVGGCPICRHDVAAFLFALLRSGRPPRIVEQTIDEPAQAKEALGIKLPDLSDSDYQLP
jgi:hypothetical protein